MAFQISPGISIKERDLTNIIPAVATTAGGFVGSFVWGPVEERVLISSEKNLASAFGLPADDNEYTDEVGINAGAVDFLTASAFLEYGNNLTVVRVLNGISSATNSTSNGATGAVVKNDQDWENQFGSSGFSNEYGIFVAKYPGALGNSISVSMSDGLGGYATSGESSDTQVFRVICDQIVIGDYQFMPSPNPEEALSVGATIGVGQSITSATANTEFKLLSEMEHNGDYTFYVQAVGSDFVTQLTAAASNKYLHFGSVGLRIKKDASGEFEVYGSNGGDINAGTAFNVWEWGSSFEAIPETSGFAANKNGANDEIHVVVYDSEGLWTGTPGTVLERFAYLSKARDAKSADGTNNYWVEVLRTQSKYVWVTDTTVATELDGSGEEFSVNSTNNTFGRFGVRDFNLRSGSSGSRPRAADYVLGYDLFSDPETVDVQLLIGNGCVTRQNATSIAQKLLSICDSRKDCLAFLSPSLNDVLSTSPDTDILSFRSSLGSTSYGFLDSGWKKRFDVYNDVDRFIPLSGDTAGSCVRTDALADPWFSPAGFNRGQIRNVVKLAFNPTKVQRDRLYSLGVNPVVTFPSEGTVLYGDKTLLTRPSAFDRINVRRLFIVLEKAIATASKYLMFELNDEFTRSQFRNMVEPFLRDVQGRRGLTDFAVVCDETNNTPDVIDRNEFRADIYLKPSRSINYIALTFINTPTGLSFNEVVG